MGNVNQLSPKDYRIRREIPNLSYPLEFLENSIQIAKAVDNVYVLLIPDMIREQEFETWAIALWFNGPLPILPSGSSCKKHIRNAWIIILKT